MAWKLTIAYRGTRFSGWQRQPNALTVQEVVETALAQLTGGKVIVVGASRTDAGVHARGQVAHCDAEALPSRALVHGTNHHLPDDVRVLRAQRVAEGFHARKHATGKLYSYRLVRSEVLSPLDAPYAVRVSPEIDVAAMNEACALLVGEHDFSAFALAGGSHRSPVRRIFSAVCEERGAELCFLIRGNGFLRGMVRSLVGTLTEVGIGRRDLESLRDLLRGASRGDAGPTAAARGLTLERVEYAPSSDPGEVQAPAAPVVS